MRYPLCDHRIDASPHPDRILMPHQLQISAGPPDTVTALWAGDDGYVYCGGRALNLPPKEQAVLHLLLARAPAVVSKDEFAARVWPGQDMSDESLTRCIHRIRHALRSQLSDPGLSGETRIEARIESLYGRGYRLNIVLAAPAASVAHQRFLSAARASPHLTEAFMYARQLSQQCTPAAFAQAEQILRDTLVTAPDYAPARVALAECLARSSSWGVNADPRLIDDGLEQLEIAERDAPTVSGLHSARAYLLDRAWRFQEAEAAFAQAFHDNPDDADTNFHYGWHLLAIGRPEAAREALRAAVRLHPFAVLLRITLARAHAHAGCMQDALQEAEAACALSPGNEMAHLYLTAFRASVCPGSDVVDAAWKLTLSRNALTLAPPILSYALARTGDTQGAIEVIDACTRCRSANTSTNAMHAASLLAIDQLDTAFALVQVAATARCGLLPVLLHDPANVALRQHPSYPALFAQVFGEQV